MTAGAPIVLAREDRLTALFAPIGGMSRAMLAVLAGSVALHLMIVATALVASRAPLAIPEQLETAVEVVQEVPKEAPKTTLKETSKETAKEEPENAPSKTAPPEPEPPKTQARMSSQTEPPKPAPASEKSVADEREALRQELAQLRAQEAQLETRRASADLGMGPLPDSFQAVALPSATDGAGEAMGYKEIIFSELAKAKGLDDRMGMPGTAGVRFSIDTAGHLIDVEIIRPSGVAALDREAIDIVRRAAPFPAPPPGAQRNFTANVSFVVQGKP